MEVSAVVSMPPLHFQKRSQHFTSCCLIAVVPPFPPGCWGRNLPRSLQIFLQFHLNLRSGGNHGNHLSYWVVNLRDVHKMSGEMGASFTLHSFWFIKSARGELAPIVKESNKSCLMRRNFFSPQSYH